MSDKKQMDCYYASGITPTEAARQAEAESSFAPPSGSPRPITVTQQELQEISSALSRHGEANLAAKIVGWLHEANS